MSKKKTNIWMPWYPADYLKDTMHLSLEEDAFYRRALDLAWIGNGEIPTDPDRLKLMLRIDKKQWKKCSWMMIKFFYVSGEFYRNIRVDLELSKANDKAEIARINGKSGGRPKTHPVIYGLQNENPEHNPNHNPEKSSSPSPSFINTKDQDKSKREPLKRFQPPTILEIAEYCNERKNGIDPEKFHAYYESNGWKVGRNPMKSWKAAITTWEKGNNNGTNKQHNQQFESAQQRKSRRIREVLGQYDENGNRKEGNYQALPVL